jgi:hypothetical protein
VSPVDLLSDGEYDEELDTRNPNEMLAHARELISLFDIMAHVLGNATRFHSRISGVSFDGFLQGPHDERIVDSLVDIMHEMDQQMDKIREVSRFSTKSRSEIRKILRPIFQDGLPAHIPPRETLSDPFVKRPRPSY